MQDKTKILFVCLGNICRSPSAEGIMRHLVAEAGLQNKFVIDSAGLLSYHAGELPDNRMRHHAKLRGYDLVSHSRPVTMDDFFDFDMIIGMDDSNIDGLKDRSPDIESQDKICRMTDFLQRHSHSYIPDPYYGGDSGFELVLDLLEDACEGLLMKLNNK